jgi:hypothetical protein
VKLRLDGPRREGKAAYPGRRGGNGLGGVQLSRRAAAARRAGDENAADEQACRDIRLERDRHTAVDVRNRVRDSHGGTAAREAR